MHLNFRTTSILHLRPDRNLDGVPGDAQHELARHRQRRGGPDSVCPDTCAELLRGRASRGCVLFSEALSKSPSKPLGCLLRGA